MSHPPVMQARIFAVDDEPSNLKLLEKMLVRQGYPAPVLIQDSRQVIAHYLEARPDLILLDINMPYLDGYKVLEQLQALDDPLLPPVIILTAQNGKDELLKALAAGARDFVSKPFSRVEFLMRVRNLLDAQIAHRLLHDNHTLLEQLVQTRTQELNNARIQAVQCLGRAAEYRDNETGFHILRMSQYSALLAKYLGCSDKQCELLQYASQMHDIGKIGIPDRILLKPGNFNDDEWEIMKTHSRIGAKILEQGDAPLICMARSIALTHHEKWDGSGYPQGLSRAAIPLEGRIVAVADVFDALTSNRPYKVAWSIDDAVQHINDGAGVHFDPAVVAIFLEHLDEILKIRDRYMEL
ncbi:MULTISPECIES: HD domain-containing phosphohydrolase [unclassified Pseudomonas]|uniref:HD domain-containing phosphohydrolase n=2 Tax=Pseudomonas TaxID=286 RepID=UPI002AB32E17|nr:MULTISPECIES: HD domain-containing phosphohydrolase [unclassified Pseudomonas]MDY7560433.1 response regulator [Pseudomonas sp. AB6]MEA9977349.1 response regulator [Pseudomonas sp. RTS4]MEA9993191.1 response regulator [Pseudomonas sp. AA4]MEB0043596.1 response regulator [Pseudomonas sp. MH10]MEB0089260.1 response regulator [Pseudomonas sp. RTI1]